MSRKYEPEVNPAIVIVSIDGLATFKSGVGSIAHWFFEAFDQIAAEAKLLQGKTWSLYALCPRIDQDSPDYSESVQATVQNTCRSYNGDFLWFDVEDGSTLKAVWSLDKRDCWYTMSANAAASIRQLASQHQKITVVAHGTMFATLRAELVDVPNVQIIYITHTLGKVFLDANSQNRIAHEIEGFKFLDSFPQDKIGYVGSYYKQVLIEQYNQPLSHLTPFENSVFKESFLFAESEGQKTIEAAGIPTEKKLIFSWGRCIPQKGFDVVVPAFEQFLAGRDDHDQWHLVLLAPQEVSAADYINQIRSALGRLPRSSYTMIESFDTSLPHKLLKHPALEIAVFASRFEAGPLTLVEALVFGHPGLKIVWHKIPPMQHLLKEQPIKFEFAELTPDLMSDAIGKAAAYDGIGIAKEKVPSFAGNIATGLDGVLGWWTADPISAATSSARQRGVA